MTVNFTVRSERDSPLRRVPFGMSQFVQRWIALAPFSLFVAVFLLWPTFSVFRSAIQPVDGSSKPAMLEAISGQYLGAILYSVRLSAITAGLGAVVGTLVAVSVVSLNQMRGLRNLLVGYSAVAANLGGIPLAFAFVASLGMQGLYTKLLNTIGINLSDIGFKISDFSGIVIVYLYFQIPLMTLVMLPAVDGLKVSHKEAAASIGATPRKYWQSVGVPLLSPSLLGGFLLLFANAFSAYATAFALSSGSSKLVSVQIRFYLQGNTITGKSNLGYALAAWMIIVMVLAMSGYLGLRRRSEKWRR
jgi:putative spermidine/putrescine transport system permease protein